MRIIKGYFGEESGRTRVSGSGTKDKSSGEEGPHCGRQYLCKVRVPKSLGMLSAATHLSRQIA